MITSFNTFISIHQEFFGVTLNSIPSDIEDPPKFTHKTANEKSGNKRKIKNDVSELNEKISNLCADVSNSDLLLEIFENLPSNEINRLTEETCSCLIPILSLWIREDSIEKKSMAIILLYELIKRFPTMLAKNRFQGLLIPLIQSIDHIQQNSEDYSEAITLSEINHLRNYLLSLLSK